MKEAVRYFTWKTYVPVINSMVFVNILAWWISDMAIKIMMDEEDNRRCPPPNTSFVKSEILEHFQIKDR